MNKKFNIIKRLGFLTLVLALAVGTILMGASPVMADAPALQTITLLSGHTTGGYTTQTAGYTYNDPSSEADTYVSGPSTETAGFTTTDPIANPLDVNSYSYGEAWPAAQVINTNASPWATIGGAQWVSTTAAHSGVETPNEGNTWRLFRATFNVSDIDAVTASIQIAADNAYEFYLNDHKIASTATLDPEAPVYGLWPGNGTQVPFTHIADINFTTPPLVAGTNTLMFVVRNWDNSGQGNPSGLIYKVTLTYGTISPLTPESYSPGTWKDAKVVDSNASPWATIGGASWVSTTSINSGVEIANEGDAWRLFKHEFDIPGDATEPISGTIKIAGDNAYEVYLINDTGTTMVATTASLAPVYGPGSGTQAPFTSTKDFTFTPVAGHNTLMFVVRNWENGNNSNPTGLLYAASITYETSTIPPPPTSVVTVGGTVYKVDKSQLLAPWLGVSLGSLLVLSLAVKGFLLRKRLHIPNR